MADIIYTAELSKAAGIWSQKNGYWNILQALPESVLTRLQRHDLLELETAVGKTTLFSVIRKTVKLSVTGQVFVTLILDHPAR